LSVGTLEPRKNGINLVAGFKEFLDKTGNQDLILLFVGKKGWLYDELFQKITEFNLEKRIIFSGYVPDRDLAAFYNLALCLVYPSFYEGFGLPVAEAMACGCPVITSDISSLAEITGANAILIDPDKPEEIAWGLEKMNFDEGFRQNLIKKGLAGVSRFNYAETARGWLRIAEKIYQAKR
jgi:glycosyltransferase involved in cell wall biosynthesis